VKRVVEKDKTLIVDGPASVTVQSGEVEVFAAPMQTAVKLVIRHGKRVPFEVKEKAEFDVLLGEKATVNEVEGSTIPASWEKAVREILTAEKPVAAMIVGGVDSGKTSFCAYLANQSLKEKHRVAIIDVDLGQSDLGPPSTISSSRITKPVLDPFDLDAENTCFVGTTSPSSTVVKVVEGIKRIKERILKRGVSVLIINTDGWIEGEDAVRFKVALVKQVKPDVVVGIQEKSELTFLLGALTETRTLCIESPVMVRKRDRDERKLLRELGYKKYLKSARAESFPLRWVKFGNTVFGVGIAPSQERLKKIEEVFLATPLYAEEMSGFVFIVLDKEQWFDEEVLKSLEQKLNRKVKVVKESDEEGLLAALHDDKENFLGIGVVEGFDYERRVARIYTPVNKGVGSIQLGHVKLDKKGREIGLSDVFSD
jgi:polynucleotide 5'-hydroxyl-kinase GRC3/NOL9